MEENEKKTTAETKVEGAKRFVGFYHYGVLLTYLSTCAGTVGIFLSLTLSPFWGCICLFISSLCDSFDGSVARTRKNRSDADKKFGMQIDSLSDLIAFVLAPVAIGYGMGLNAWYFIVLYCIFVMSGLCRLAYYNVTEEERAAKEGGNRKYFEGLPVAIDVYVIPVFYLIVTMVNNRIVTLLMMGGAYAILAFLFVFRFRMPKADTRTLLISAVIVAVVVIGLSLIKVYVVGVPLISMPVAEAAGLACV